MATSGSTDYSLSRNDVIREAFGLALQDGYGETISNEDYEAAARALNMMLKTWQAEGLRLWLTKEGSMTLTASKQSYTMGSGGNHTERPLRILSMRFRDSNSRDLPMERMSREEYFDLPVKSSSSSAPTQFYYDPGRAIGTLYIWPTLASGTTGSVRFTYERPIEDLDANTDDFDLPQEWLETISYNLAVRLAPRYGAAKGENFAEIKNAAVGLKARLDAWDDEPASIYRQPARM